MPYVRIFVLCCLASCAVILTLALPASAQFGDGAPPTKAPIKSTTSDTSPTSDSSNAQEFEARSRTSRWRVGFEITAQGGPCTGMFATIPVPTEWEDQNVKVVEENITPTVRRTRFRTLPGGVKQMLITIPKLNAGEKASAVVTYEIERITRPVPRGAETFTIAASPPKNVKSYLGPSPYIESRHKQIRNLAAELKDESLTDWQQIERFYDYVRENVEYKNGDLKGALQALRDGDGDCEELTSLFIALCRAHGVPARTVWVPNHCYPEFYLVDENEEGQWLPCQAAGDREFGTISELRPILQKGDNFKVPEKKGRQRYVAEHLTGKGGRPRIRTIRDEIRVNE